MESYYFYRYRRVYQCDSNAEIALILSKYRDGRSKVIKLYKCYTELLNVLKIQNLCAVQIAEWLKFSHFHHGHLLLKCNYDLLAFFAAK